MLSLNIDFYTVRLEISVSKICKMYTAQNLRNYYIEFIYSICIFKIIYANICCRKVCGGKSK